MREQERVKFLTGLFWIQHLQKVILFLFGLNSHALVTRVEIGRQGQNQLIYFVRLLWI